MAAVRGKHTSPEVALRKGLYAAGVRGWRCHYKRAPGTPDLAWPARRVAVFVDGAFWHGHPSRHKPGRSGIFWDEKIERNVARDHVVNAQLEALGWRVVRVWDFEVRKNIGDVVENISRVLRNAERRPKGPSPADDVALTQSAKRRLGARSPRQAGRCG
jgi:DNA mismatch endonuclease (patch repair protein)